MKVKLLSGHVGSGKHTMCVIYQLKAFFGFKWYLLSKKQKKVLINYLMNYLYGNKEYK